MKKEWKAYYMETDPMAAKKAVVQGAHYRFTVLTDRLIRLEYQENGAFIDSPTQKVVCRNFPVPSFRVIEEEDRLEIVTDQIHLYYDKKKFSKEGLFLQLKEGYALYGSVWYYGDKTNDLLGTARTLDNADGAIELEHGLMSRDGFTILDDSASALMQEDGWIAPKTMEGEDLYFFGYGHDYLGCLKDFYRLCGKTPMLPRFTMGNWWSRFYAYTEESYLELMDRFREKEIPFSTAVIDMDWHLTRLPKKYGSGWTGYTWNPEYFPKPERFLQKLHNMGMHVTLNVHPADGVRGHEEAYLPMAKEMGIDYENEDKIPFDVSDPEFMEAYFKYLHHPNEARGVDFWWLDWQQGSRSAMKGMDTLWMLNHLHFIDNGRDGKIPLTFSRYAGIGSHRYPIGFSGDTLSTWESLDFQPYFTVNASNAGYTWWSHDIGGHQKGIRDDEMAVRWIQFGVFSPIMRLHSTCNAFYGKEPWNYGMEAEKVMTSFLQLRHRLIPYLYTMNYLTHTQGLPLVQPMYYKHDREEAYHVPNEYYFGQNMIVCPITRPADRNTLLGSFDAWIPEGMYFDFFTGNVYRGGRKLVLYRNLESIPVLVPAGSILPLAEDFAQSHRKNPQILELRVYGGADGTFVLYEDDCSEMAKRAEAFTSLSFQAGIKNVFTMEISGEAADVIPTERQYRIRFFGVQDPENVCVLAEGGSVLEQSVEKENHILMLLVGGTSIEKLMVTFEQKSGIGIPDKKQEIYEMLHKAQISYDQKEQIFGLIQRENSIPRIAAALHELQVSAEIQGALLELLTADC